MITRQTKFIDIIDTNTNLCGKTIYNVKNKKQQVIAGMAWYPPWKKYVVYFAEDSIIDDKCLSTILDFLTHLNKNV